jgi:hypothetical protein
VRACACRSAIACCCCCCCRCCCASCIAPAAVTPVPWLVVLCMLLQLGLLLGL